MSGHNTDAAAVSRAEPTRYLILFGGVCAVGSAALMARAALDRGVGPISLSAWRLTIASLILVAAARMRPAEERPVARPVAIRLIVAGGCLGLHFATWFASLRLMPVARSTLLVTTAPVWAGLASWILLRNAPPPRFWAGLLVACAGTYVVVMHGAAARGTGALGTSWQGDLLAVLGAILVAAYLLLVEDLQTTLGTRTVVAWTYSAAAVSLWPIALVARDSVLPSEPAAWWAILGLALVPQLIGHTALNWSLRWFSPGAVAAATLLEPVFAGLLAWWILSEGISAIQGLGAIILLAGVALAVQSEKAEIAV